MVEYGIREIATGIVTHRNAGGYALAGLVDGLRLNERKDEFEVVYRFDDEPWEPIETLD